MTRLILFCLSLVLSFFSHAGRMQIIRLEQAGQITKAEVERTLSIIAPNPEDKESISWRTYEEILILIDYTKFDCHEPAGFENSIALLQSARTQAELASSLALINISSNQYARLRALRYPTRLVNENVLQILGAVLASPVLLQHKPGKYVFTENKGNSYNFHQKEMRYRDDVMLEFVRFVTSLTSDYFQMSTEMQSRLSLSLQTLLGPNNKKVYWSPSAIEELADAVREEKIRLGAPELRRMVELAPEQKGEVDANQASPLLAVAKAAAEIKMSQEERSAIILTAFSKDRKANTWSTQVADLYKELFEKSVVDTEPSLEGRTVLNLRFSKVSAQRQLKKLRDSFE